MTDPHELDELASAHLDGATTPEEAARSPPTPSSRRGWRSSGRSARPWPRSRRSTPAGATPRSPPPSPPSTRTARRVGPSPPVTELAPRRGLSPRTARGARRRRGRRAPRAACAARCPTADQDDDEAAESTTTGDDADRGRARIAPRTAAPRLAAGDAAADRDRHRWTAASASQRHRSAPSTTSTTLDAPRLGRRRRRSIADDAQPDDTAVTPAAHDARARRATPRGRPRGDREVRHVDADLRAPCRRGARRAAPGSRGRSDRPPQRRCRPDADTHTALDGRPLGESIQPPGDAAKDDRRHPPPRCDRHDHHLADHSPKSGRRPRQRAGELVLAEDQRAEGRPPRRAPGRGGAPGHGPVTVPAAGRAVAHL